MSLSLNRSSHVGAIGLAAVWSALSIGTMIAPAPAEARSAEVFYVAELAGPAPQSRAVAGGIAWYCEGNRCIAGKGNSRPLRMCRELQREVGPITAFTVEGEALEADKLARCNG